MTFVKQLKEELANKKKLDNLSRKNLVWLEQAKFKDLLAEFGKCQKCSRTERLTLDHIVPKDILRSFGIETDTDFIEDNYILLCKVCNTFKANKLDFSIPRTKVILIHLIESI